MVCLMTRCVTRKWSSSFIRKFAASKPLHNQLESWHKSKMFLRRRWQYTLSIAEKEAFIEVKVVSGFWKVLFENFTGVQSNIYCNNQWRWMGRHIISIRQSFFLFEYFSQRPLHFCVVQRLQATQSTQLQSSIDQRRPTRHHRLSRTLSKLSNNGSRKKQP